MNIKKILSGKAIPILVGSLSILIALWVVLYALPGLLASLFNTILGNIIMIMFIILIGTKDIRIAIGLIVLFAILFRFSYYVTNVTNVNREKFLSKNGIYPFAHKNPNK